MSTITEARPFAVGDKVRITDTPYPGAIPNGTVGTVTQTRWGGNNPDVAFDQRMGDFPKGCDVLFFRHEIELVEEGSESEPQEIVPNDTVVRITNSSYSSVRSGMLGTITTKYHQHRGGCYGIKLSEDTAVFGKGEGVAFYRDQFEIVERTNTKASDLKVGDKVRMVYPERVPLYTPVLGQVGEVIPLDTTFAKEGDGLVTVKFEDDTMTCYAYRLELVEKFIPGEPVEDVSTLGAGDIVNIQWNGERIQGKLYENGGNLRISASASGIPNYEPYVVLLGSGSPRAAGAIHDVRLVEKFVPPIPGEPVEDLSTLRAGDIVNVSWDGERIQGELFESTGAFAGGLTLRVRAGSEPNVVWLEGSELAFGVSDVRLVERNMVAREEAERERLLEACLALEVGDRVKIVKAPVSIDDPLDVIEGVEVGATGKITYSYGDTDFEVEFDDELSVVIAGGCLERVAPLGRDLKVGDVVESVEQLEGMAICTVVTNEFGAAFVKSWDSVGWLAWSGSKYDSATIETMGTLTVVFTRATD